MTTALDRLDRVLSRSTRTLWRGRSGTIADAVRRQRDAHVRATTIVRAFYGLSLMWVAQEMGRWNNLRGTAAIRAAWPASWIPDDDPRTGITAVLVLFTVGAIWAAVAPEQRFARLTFAVGLLQYMAVVNGFGKISHNLHAALYIAFVLVLLPGRPWERGATVARRQQFLTVVWSAQAVVLLAYALTGFWKLYYAGRALLDTSEPTMLHPEGFSVLLATRLAATDQTTLLGDQIIDLPWLGWLLYLGTIYLEAGSLLVIMRPRLHRIWGFGLIAFHLGTQLMMGFTFTQNIAILALFFVLSPMTVERDPIRDVIGDLPGILEGRALLRRIRRR